MKFVTQATAAIKPNNTILWVVIFFAVLLIYVPSCGGVPPVVDSLYDMHYNQIWHCENSQFAVF